MALAARACDAAPRVERGCAGTIQSRRSAAGVPSSLQEALFLLERFARRSAS
jgi:hypothetical protein